MCMANSRHSINAGLIIIATDPRFSARGHSSPRTRWAASGGGGSWPRVGGAGDAARHPTGVRDGPLERPGRDVTVPGRGGGALLKINHGPHYSFMFTLQRWKLGLGEVRRLVRGHTVSQDRATLCSRTRSCRAHCLLTSRATSGHSLCLSEPQFARPEDGAKTAFWPSGLRGGKPRGRVKSARLHGQRALSSSLSEPQARTGNLGLDPGSTAARLGDLGQVAPPLWASVSSNGDNKSTDLTGT